MKLLKHYSMKKLITLSFLILTLAFISCSKYKYESVKGDPTESRIYTLDNGLKVYLTRNTDVPRIQTYVAVKVGAKNDPLETTGLAHYFEHLMFKGSKRFGTQNYEAEKPMLDSIEMLFEVYRKENDPQKRTEIYAIIDSVSQEASKIAIPNEYDKLMSAIGSEGTNAWTSFDETCYTEDIPSNQLENWAAIQSDRFQNAIIRGFHTELETVYEEYNMSLTNDMNKIFYKILEMLYPKHPYGMHTVLGKQEHLKNPSITNIKNYYSTYYVPNNYAICLAGDIEFNRTIELIDRYFGNITPNNNLPKWKIPEEDPITEPLEATITGLDAENISIAWRSPRASSKENLIADLASMMLSNGKCGLIDVDLNQSQKVLEAQTIFDAFADEGIFAVIGMPKDGQTLDDVKSLLISEIDKLRKGDFDESLIASTVANYKVYAMKRLESNEGRAQLFIDSYINDRPWKDIVEEIDNTSKITKDDIVAWTNNNLKDNNFVVVYKRQGTDESQKKIDKPHITPIATNRNECSAFLDSIQNVQVTPIQPVFVDYNKDMSFAKMKQEIPVLYKQNITNGLFDLKYIYETGSNSKPELGFAVNRYFELLGTSDKTLQEIQNELYALACNFNFSVRADRTTITINGLGENMEKAISLVEDYISNVEGNEEILSELKKDIIKERENNKQNQRANFNALTNYGKFGRETIRKTIMDNEKIMALTSDELVAEIKKITGYNHRILYYGPLSCENLIKTLDNCHIVADQLHIPDNITYPYITSDVNKVTFAQYDAKQIYYQQHSCQESKFDITIEPSKYMFNNYFGGGMNGIVFQEMREARGLAYSASAQLSSGRNFNDPYTFNAFIATQNDKVRQAVEAFESIIEDMPESEHAFTIAKQYAITSLATNRTIKADILYSWIQAQDMGLDYDLDRIIYDSIQNITLNDVKEFQQKYIKGRKYNYMILGDWNDLDTEYIKSLGEVEKVSQEDIFGY